VSGRVGRHGWTKLALFSRTEPGRGGALMSTGLSEDVTSVTSYQITGIALSCSESSLPSYGTNPLSDFES
jgi:hypothetical protein